MRRLSYSLSRGQLDLTIRHELEPFENLLGVAERINPKRAFLFVSKVTGRYVPTSLSEMIRTTALLASQVPPCLLEGATTVLSLSETALGLGTLVHNYFKNTYKLSLVNCYTSRHKYVAQLRSQFVEPHSHIPHHNVHYSYDGQVNSAIDNTETLVLVDDEITTGDTLKNLYKSLNLRNVRRVIILSIADWSGKNTFDWEGVEVHNFSLITGEYTWTPGNDELVSLPYEEVQEDLLDVEINSIRFPSFYGLSFNAYRDNTMSASSFSSLSPLNTCKKVICLYYNETLPQVLEAALKQRESIFSNTVEYYFLSLSSSPLEVGLDIQSKIELPGKYSSRPVYLYNFQSVAKNDSNEVYYALYDEFPSQHCDGHLELRRILALYGICLPGSSSIFDNNERILSLSIHNQRSREAPSDMSPYYEDFACLF